MAAQQRPPLRFDLPEGRRPVVELVDEEMVRILAAKSGAERLAMAADALQLARQLIQSSIRSAHPDWDEQRVAGEAARRLLGDCT